MKVPHDDRCRDRIGELEQVSGTLRPEVEIPRPGEEVDVGESTDRVARPVEEQPIPTRVGGSSGSGTRSGVGSRASETNTDDREVKRVRVAESRGQRRQGEGCGRIGSEGGRTTS